MHTRCLGPLAGTLWFIAAQFPLGGEGPAIAQAPDNASMAQVEAHYRDARRQLSLAQARQRAKQVKRPSLVMHTAVGWQLGEWNIHESLDGFGSGGVEAGLSYRQFWSGRAGISIGGGLGRSRVALARKQGGPYEFGRKDLHLEVALHLRPREGGRLYLGPTFRAGYWRFLRDGLDFVDPEEQRWWGPYDRVPIGNAWALTGGPHVGWLVGRRSDFDLSIVGLAGVWGDGSHWSLVAGAHVRLGYVFALGR